VGPSGGTRDSATLGVALDTQLLDQAPEFVQTPASQASHHRAVQPVQKLPAAPAPHEQGDKVSRRPMVENLHHAYVLRKVHTGCEVLQ
jgi:hypothetical protein